MRNTKVYDLPTRIFHWLIAGLFVISFIIAKTVDDESATFSYHMLIGIMLTFIVTLRIIWGFIGSRYAKFSHFKLRPNDLIEYFRNFFSSRGKRYLGHNPASSWAALTMYALIFGLGLSGFMMAKGIRKDLFEELHELFAVGFVIVAAAHILGVLFHGFRHHDKIGLSMIDGNKEPVARKPGITKTHRFAAAVFVFLMGGFAFQVHRNYDSTKQSLNLFGLTSLQLGESEDSDEGHAQGGGENEEDDKDEHEDND